MQDAEKATQRYSWLTTAASGVWRYFYTLLEARIIATMSSYTPLVKVRVEYKYLDYDAKRRESWVISGKLMGILLAPVTYTSVWCDLSMKGINDSIKWTTITWQS